MKTLYFLLLGLMLCASPVFAQKTNPDLPKPTLKVTKIGENRVKVEVTENAESTNSINLYVKFKWFPESASDSTVSLQNVVSGTYEYDLYTGATVFEARARDATLSESVGVFSPPIDLPIKSFSLSVVKDENTFTINGIAPIELKGGVFF